MKSAHQSSGDLGEEVTNFLSGYGYFKTARHCFTVAEQAQFLAISMSGNVRKAHTAGWLHDVSVVIPDDQRLIFARTMGVEVLPEEEKHPFILHQKLSVVVAREIFAITDGEILSAIGCHTTLKEGASRLDKIVFLADKIAWDQSGQPPYLVEMLTALRISLDQAVLVYLDYIWENRTQLPLVHPWLRAAREELHRSVVD